LEMRQIVHGIAQNITLPAGSVMPATPTLYNLREQASLERWTNLRRSISYFRYASGRTTHQGFPPPDPRVRDYLTGRDAESHVDYPSTSVRAASFLTALFQKTAEEIVKMGGELGGNTSMVTLASEFRKRMSVGQSVDQCNAFRTEFYDDIVNRAREKIYAVRT